MQTTRPKLYVISISFLLSRTCSRHHEIYRRKNEVEVGGKYSICTNRILFAMNGDSAGNVLTMFVVNHVNAKTQVFSGRPMGTTGRRVVRKYFYGLSIYFDTCTQKSLRKACE